MDISDKIKKARLKLEKMSDEEFIAVVGKAFIGIIKEELKDINEKH